jgi:membrane protein YdbS with pleckstrin-like domain
MLNNLIEFAVMVYLIAAVHFIFILPFAIYEKWRKKREKHDYIMPD